MITVLKYLSIGLLIAFGLLSIFLTSAVIFDLFGVREAEGNYIPFIVYTNLGCGILYVLSAFLLFRSKSSVVYFLGVATVSLIVAYTALQVHIEQGGVYEIKTVNAMLFRITFTGVLTGLTWYITKQSLTKK